MALDALTAGATICFREYITEILDLKTCAFPMSPALAQPFGLV